MSPLQTYLTALHFVRSTGAGVAETSHYPALAALLDAVGASLQPAVRCVGQLANLLGAGSPDFGLYAGNQFPRRADLAAKPPAGEKPARGVVEAKGTAADVLAIAASPQVAKYLAEYGLVLVTNYRDFLLVSRGPGGVAVPGERYTLADSDPAFWTALGRNPAALAARHEIGLGEFLRRALLHEAPLTRPQDVAFFLASYARHALRLLDEQADLPALKTVRTALEEALGVRFEGEKGEHFFRSTLVQTLFYGVFSAWVLWSREQGPPPIIPGVPGPRFDWKLAAWSLRVPILRTLFVQITNPGQLQPLGLDRLLDWTSAALNRVDRAGFFAAFDAAGADAVQYFYEPFLAAFDPELRRQLGVWYTPREIVRYQVARVDHLLKTELGLPDGLADPSVYVLDPCCGTGAYLVETLRRVEENLRARGDADALLASDLKTAARTRLFGFELIPAPFVVAHLQIGLKLAQAGAPLLGDERAAVFLTNALTGWEPLSAERAPLLFPELDAERTAAEEVKRAKPILVILGNPPYNGFAGIAPDEAEERSEERDLSTAYRTPRPGLPAPQGQGLNDLYVRFFRMAERRIAYGQPGRGIVSFISNYSWLDGLSHTVMRARYLEAFDEVWIDNLHGDRIISEVAPDGKASNTIFATGSDAPGIKVGTAIATLIRRDGEAVPTRIASLRYRDFNESNPAERRAALSASVEPFDSESYQTLTPLPALGIPFKPRLVSDAYLAWTKLADLIPNAFSGVKTARDADLVSIDEAKLRQRISQYFDPLISHEDAVKIVPELMGNDARFDARNTRDVLRQRGADAGEFLRYHYRPLDARWLYWDPDTKLLDEKRADFRAQVFPSNSFLVLAQRTRKGFEPPIVSRQIVSYHVIESVSICFPLLIRDTAILGGTPGEPRPNLSPAALKYLAGLDVPADSLFFHAVATLHAPDYRTENAGALRQDWPRIPLPADKEILLASTALGRRVAALLDPETPVPGVTTGTVELHLRRIAALTRADDPHGALDPATDLAVTAGWGHFGQGGAVMPGRGHVAPFNDLDSGGLDEDLDGTPLRTGPDYYRIHLNARACWDFVPRAVWEYTLGGYPVLKKWLSYREESVLGRALRPEEAREFTAIARRIAALLRLGPDLDAAYRAAAVPAR